MNLIQYWVDDLLYGGYKQYRGQLRTHTLGGWHYCAVGVLANRLVLLNQLIWNPISLVHITTPEEFNRMPNTITGHKLLLSSHHLPRDLDPWQLSIITGRIPSQLVPTNLDPDVYHSISTLNDRGYSLEVLANILIGWMSLEGVDYKPRAMSNVVSYRVGENHEQRINDSSIKVLVSGP